MRFWSACCKNKAVKFVLALPYCICRFLVLKRQHDSDRGFIVVRNLLLCLWFLRRFKVIFSRRRYPDKLVQSTIRQFVASKVSEESQTQQQVPDNNEAPIRIVLPFKDQKSADAVRRQLANVSWKINATISPVYTSRKIKVDIKVREDKPPLVNQQCVVYHFQCNLCDVGYTCRHLHQRIEEHKGTAVGNHLKDQHSMSPNDLREILKFSGSARTNLIALLLKCFLLKNWNQI